ncbi:ArsR/SmtB family transcription factor [Fodinicola feengrottensis]|uniref:HTH arsR-type domain-containing protein n=1 Tax=Fodinicola feengrottensis TaxID=435914 RepID=A0ABN2GZN2_9ACTN|nr:metalloregulator ArsR/SmtB family transcription factor [Fodinicola feengrottensis]
MLDEVEVLKALAHPVRLGIVRRLAREPDTCACDFTDYFDVAQPTISAHLKVLRSAGVVTTRREGTTICYSLVPTAVELVAGIFEAVLADVRADKPVPNHT